MPMNSFTRLLSPTTLRRIFSVWLGAIFLSAAAVRLVAVEASPIPFKVTQVDGTTVKLRIRGDEYYNWLEDAKGYTVLKAKDGKYVYATLLPDGSLGPTALRAGLAEPKAAGLKPRLLPSAEIRQQRATSMALAAGAGPQGAPAADGPQRISASGAVKNLVILCRFADHTAAQGRTQAEYDTLFNAVGGHPTLAPTGSVRDFYTENSYGTMTLQSTVIAWVTLPQTEAYYAAGSNALGTYPRNAQRMAEDALNLADPLVNFAQFDQDNDGFVDAIDIIHSGYGAETGGGGGNWVWSHKWALPSNWTSAESNASGVRVKVRDYHSEPALWGTSGTEILRIGVVCHETGHFFGLPDLYDTDSSSEGIGSWCLMANSWGFDHTQFHPPHFSAWCKIQLGWVTPTVISSGNFTAPQVETTPKIFKITTGYPAGEYLLVENRQPYGFENAMPQGGLCIWHIDEAKSNNQSEGYPGQAGWPGNNNHYKVALLQADGNYDMERDSGRGDSGDAYHAGGVTTISPTTVPNTNRYQGGISASTSNIIDAISASGETMTFTLNPPPTGPPVITSSLTAFASLGNAFSYQITATDYPSSFSVSGLPGGLTFTAATGVIAGTPTGAGTFNLTLGATNVLGTGHATVVLTVTNLSVAVGNALETPGRTFVFSGDANWIPQSVTTQDGVDAIESGAHADGQLSTLTTTVTGPINVTFWRKISSEPNYDYLRFYVDDVLQSQISGEEDWALDSAAMGAGSHILRWTYSKDFSVSVGSDAAWVDGLTIAPITDPPVVTSAATVSGFKSTAFIYQIAATNAPASYSASGLPAWLSVNATTGRITGTPAASGTFNFTVSATNTPGTGSRAVSLTIADPLISLPDALDFPSLTFTSAGGLPWYRQTDVSFDGTDAAENAITPDGGSTIMETTFAGPGTVSFAWKVSSEEGYDFLRFSVDGTEVGSITGEVEWTVFSRALSAGTHVLRWAYTKDSSYSDGEDRGWVDIFRTGLPVITSPLEATGYANESFSYQITSVGGATGYGATGLPDGLAVNPESGIIYGIPTVQGFFSVTLRATNSLGTVSSLLPLVIEPPAVGRRVVVPWDQTWKYFQPMGLFPTPAGNFASTWYAPEATFSATYTGPPFGSPFADGDPSVANSYDSGTGSGPFGYEDIDYFHLVGAEFIKFGKTLTQPVSGKRYAAYFRTTFTVNSGPLLLPRLRYVIDDGAFIYLDGQLLVTVNMPGGAVDSYNQLATASTNPEANLFTVNLGVAGIVAGGNAVVNRALTSLSPGLHTLAVSARSNATNSSDLCMALELSGDLSWSTATASVAASADDAEETATGSVNLTSTHLELINDDASGAGDQIVGLRFAGLAIPRNALITSATIQFKAFETQSDPTALRVAAQSADTAPIFTTAAHNLSGRALTATNILWQPNAWATVGAASAAQRTPNLAAVVQEIVSRPGWNSGNAMAFLISGLGHRTADAFDKAGGVPARLNITYSTAPNPSFAQWISNYPALTGGNALNTANPDGDAFNNLLEYALATNPQSPNGVPYSVTMEDGNFVLIYTRPSFAPDLTYTVQWSDTLAAASWSSVGISQQVISDDGATRTIRAVAPPSDAKIFMRLKVSSP
jgi:M6 family metalloprotease-like protein